MELHTDIHGEDLAGARMISLVIPIHKEAVLLDERYRRVAEAVRGRPESNRSVGLRRTEIVA